jgi:hypothetical protein
MTSFKDEIAAGDRILTAAEVADYCRIGLSTLRQYIYAGCGPPGFKAGQRLDRAAGNSAAPMSTPGWTPVASCAAPDQT